MSILSIFTRKPSPSQAGQALSSLTQRSITAREHEKRKAEMTARPRAEIAARNVQ